NPRKTLTIHWNGKSWSVVSSPNPQQMDVLQGVGGSGPNDVWAVGYQSDGATSATLALHWDGHGWNVVASANPSATFNAMRGVVSLSSNDAWTAGYQADGNGEMVTLIEHWDGSVWTVSSSPNPGPSTNVLIGMAEVSGPRLWAAGYQDSNGGQSTL